MKTMEVTKGYRLSEWAGILQARKESGLNIKDYCEDVGIPEHRYYYWQRKLREAAHEDMKESRSIMTGLTPSGFMEVKIPSLQSVLSPTSTSHDQLCVESPGVRITAGSEYPVEKLVVLLREVMQPC